MSHLSETLLHAGFIVIKADAYPGIGNEQAIYGLAAQEIADAVLGIVEVGFAGIGGITDEQESHGSI
jgi:hypothetical protein